MLIIFVKNGDILNKHFGMPFFTLMSIFLLCVLSSSRRWHNIVINGNKYGVWHNIENGRVYISDDYDPSCKLIVALQFDDHTPESKYISMRKNGFVRVLLEYYKNGDLYFENMKIKNNALKILRKCLSY